MVIENGSARDKGFKKEGVGNKIGDVGLKKEGKVRVR